MHDDLAVAVGREAMAFPDQFLPQLPVVIDLAIADQGDRAVLIEQRLPAPLQIDDRQAGVPQPALIDQMNITVIRAAMLKCFYHPLDPVS
ncbi:MAG: hypothetical protein IH891_11055 [Planctomycetes bacterium]|nr:hypothetical protein [Planctomycetota bacterium]